jgi:CBS domain-containing protein
VLIVSRSLPQDETFVEAFNKLIGNSILSAPVRDVKTNKYVGFLEMRDLLSILLLTEEADRSNITDIDALLKHVHDHLKVTRS